MNIWYAVFNSLKVMMMLPQDLFTMIHYLNGLGVGSKGRKGMLIIWNTVFWSLWRWRNQGIFKNASAIIMKFLKKLKYCLGGGF
jgi:hypothetical protein